MAAAETAAGAPPSPPGTGEPAADIIDRNIAALLQRREQQRTEAPRHDRIADAITAFAGSMRFVYLHLAVYGGWIVLNLGWLPLEPFDPTFVKLAMIASVEAIFISSFVLISQNRMAASADKRADLDLQISLLAEHEITRLVELVTELARRADIPAAQDPELQELGRLVSAEGVLDRIERPAGSAAAAAKGRSPDSAQS